MVTLEFRLVGKPRQYAALDEAIRTTQFIRNKCVRYWQDTRGVTPYDLNKYCTVLACEYAFVRKLNSMARQAAAERASAAITHFYQNCRAKKRGKKGYPRFQKDCRSVEYKTTGWMLDDVRRHLSLTDGLGMGTFKLKGTRDLLECALGAIKRVRLLRRADGYYAQFAIAVERHVVVEPSGKAIGIDLGLTQFYTDSQGDGTPWSASPLAEPRIPRAVAVGVSNWDVRSTVALQGASRYRTVALQGASRYHGTRGPHATVALHGTASLQLAANGLR